MRTYALRTLTVGAVVVGLSLIVTGLAAAEVEDGGWEGNFLSWGAGARSLGMGRSFVAIADDATATYWNPAGLTQLDRVEASALHAMLWEGVNYDFLSFAIPTLTAGAFGANITLLTVDGLERRDRENNVVEGGIAHWKAAAGLSYAYPVAPWLSVGASVKYLSRWLDGSQSGFVTGDLSCLVKPFDGVSIGLVGQHLFASRFGDTADTLSPVLKLGVAARLLDGLLLVTSELEARQTATGQTVTKFRVGGESALMGPLSLRVGTDTREYSAGVGFAYSFLRLDYGAALHRELGLSHRVSLNVGLGASMAASRDTRAKLGYEYALRAFSLGHLAVAERALTDVLSYDPTNRVAAALHERVRVQQAGTGEEPTQEQPAAEPKAK